MAEIYSDNFPLNETICKNCAFRLSRIVSPIDPTSFGISEEDLIEMDVSEDEEINIEAHTCLILHSDMDYIVKDCSHFRKMEAGSILINNPFEI
jgi:hypothetical protein